MKKFYVEKMENNDVFKNLILSLSKDTLIYIPSKLFPALLGYIGLSIYTREFSSAEYGDYSLIITTTGIFGIFVYSWLNLSNLRFFSIYRNKGKLNNFFSTSFFTLIGTLMCSFVILLFFSKFLPLPNSIIHYLILVMGAMFASSFYETTMTILRSDRKSKAYSFFGSLSAGLSLAISLLLIYIFNYRISAILIGYILAYLLLSVVIIFKYSFHRFVNFKHFSKETLKELIDYGIPLIVTLLFSWILALSDRYIIEYFRGNQEVGIYSAAYQLAEYPILMISSIITMAAFPIIIDTWEKDGDKITQTFITDIVRYYLILSIPICFGLALFSQNFIRLLGSQFAEGSLIVPWVAIGAFTTGLDIYIGKGLELKRKTKYMSLIMSIAAIGNIAMNFILVPHYGFYGAGISTALSYLLYLGLTWKISWKYLPWRFPIKSFGHCTIVSILMSGFLFILMNIMQIQSVILNLLMLTVTGSLIYFGFLYFIGELKMEINFLIKIIINNFLFFRKKNKLL